VRALATNATVSSEIVLLLVVVTGLAAMPGSLTALYVVLWLKAYEIVMCLIQRESNKCRQSHSGVARGA